MNGTDCLKYEIGINKTGLLFDEDPVYLYNIQVKMYFH